MAANYPIATAGSREPDKRPRPIPKVVREAILLMIYGDPEDEDGLPIDFISAAKAVGMQPQTLRRYLHRPQVIALLRAERRAFREAVLAGNELALQRVRDGDQHSNPMARVAAARALEQLGDVDHDRPVGTSSTPGVTIRLIAQAAPPAPMIDVSPVIDAEPAERAFKPRG
jgi:hypothetical protein